MAALLRFVSQDALMAMWDLVDVAPKPPVITSIDGSRIVVRIAGTTPDPALLAVEGVEVQQECGTVRVVAPTDVAEVPRVACEERLRLRWLKDGVGGPWSNWTAVVSGRSCGVFVFGSQVY
jgi:hypothetical protein